MKIQKKVFFLMVACVGISFLVFGIITFHSKEFLFKEISNTSQNFSESTATEAWNSLNNQVQGSITALTVARANQIEDEIQDMQSETLKLSKKISRIVSNLNQYGYREISDPRGQNVINDVPYILYSPEIAYSRSFALEDEIWRVANIQDELQNVSESFNPYKNSCYIASENGYFICVDYYPPEQETDFINSDSTFDARQRPWYQKAAADNELTFSDVFLDTDKELSITCAAPYYQNEEFAGVVGIGINISAWYKRVMKLLHQEGRIGFILNQEGEIIFSSFTEGDLAATEKKVNLREVSNKEIAEIATKMVNGETGISAIKLYSDNYYLSYAPLPTLGWSFGILTSRQAVIESAERARANFITRVQIFNDRINSIYQHITWESAISFLVVLLVLSFISEKLAKKFSKPINILSETVKEISGGNLDKKIELKTGDEMEDLANSFNVMTENLKTQMKNLEKVTSDKEKIATELKLATGIQLGMLPRNFDFGRKDFEIFATMNAAKAVGGDFYDFYLLDENHLVVTMADVSGKGVPAALFMSRSKTILKNFATMMQNPDDFAAVMTLANNQLCQDNEEMMFVTVFMGMLDLKTGKFIFVNGGHNPPMWYNSQEKTFSYLELEENCVLGMMDGLDFVQQEINLNQGDILYLYTDGVTEAMDENNNQYGETRLSEILNGVDKTADLQVILEKVREDLKKHAGAAEQSDDITMLAVRFNKEK